MRFAASLKRLLFSLLLLACGRVCAFATHSYAHFAAGPSQRRRPEGGPRLAARLAEAIIFPSRFFFWPYAIGPP